MRHKNLLFWSIVSLLSLTHVASAKCRFVAPCRSVELAVLNCALDIDATESRKKTLEKYTATGTPLPAYLNKLSANPYGFRLVARITSAKALQCEGQSPLPDAIIRDKSNVADAIGEERALSYWGKTVNECATLLKATEVKIKMSQDWCEWGKLSTHPAHFAEIESIVK